MYASLSSSASFVVSILLEKGRGYQWQKAADQRLFET